MKVLYVTANPKNIENSYTLRLSSFFVENYKKNNPSDEIIELNLYKENIPLIDFDVMCAWDKCMKGTEVTQKEKSILDRMGFLLDQFINVDKIILAAPFWNFGFPPLVKAYIDNLIILDKSFKFTESGAIGLLKDKPFLLVQARGGVYSTEPNKSFEFAESHLRSILYFVGIKNFKTLLCEGVHIDPSKAEEILNKSKEEAIKLAKTF